MIKPQCLQNNSSPDPDIRSTAKNELVNTNNIACSDVVKRAAALQQNRRVKMPSIRKTLVKYFLLSSDDRYSILHKSSQCNFKEHHKKENDTGLVREGTFLMYWPTSESSA
jgi:hypothetical protein